MIGEYPIGIQGSQEAKRTMVKQLEAGCDFRLTFRGSTSQSQKYKLEKGEGPEK